MKNSRDQNGNECVSVIQQVSSTGSYSTHGVVGEDGTVYEEMSWTKSRRSEEGKESLS